MPNTLTVIDNRTSLRYEIPVHQGAIRTMDLRTIRTTPDDFGILGYDPAFMNTASCQSAVTFIDGDKGVLRYRGYGIEYLAEKCSFLEVAYLLLFGELPTAVDLHGWVQTITHHTMIHETTKKFLEGFHYDAHPMGMFISTVAALSTVYPEARWWLNPLAERRARGTDLLIDPLFFRIHTVSMTGLRAVAEGEAAGGS